MKTGIWLEGGEIQVLGGALKPLKSGCYIVNESLYIDDDCITADALLRAIQRGLRAGTITFHPEGAPN